MNFLKQAAAAVKDVAVSAKEDIELEALKNERKKLKENILLLNKKVEEYDQQSKSQWIILLVYAYPLIYLGLLKQKLTESLDKVNETLVTVLSICNANKVSLTTVTEDIDPVAYAVDKNNVPVATLAATSDGTIVSGGSAPIAKETFVSSSPDISTLKIGDSESFKKLQKKAHDDLVRYRNETRVIVDKLSEIVAKGTDRYLNDIQSKEKRIEKINERLKEIRNK